MRRRVQKKGKGKIKENKNFYLFCDFFIYSGAINTYINYTDGHFFHFPVRKDNRIGKRDWRA
jgi:hypothetical protein